MKSPEEERKESLTYNLCTFRSNKNKLLHIIDEYIHIVYIVFIDIFRHTSVFTTYQLQQNILVLPNILIL